MTFVLEMAHVLPIVLHKMFDIVLRENNDNNSEWKGQKYPRPCELMGGRKLLWVWWRCNLSQFGPLLCHKSYQDKTVAVMHLWPFTLQVMLLFQMRGGRCWNEWWCPDRVNKNWHGCLSALLYTAHHCCQPGQPQTQSKCWTQTTARHHFRSAEGPEMYSSFHFVTEGCTQNIYMVVVLRMFRSMSVLTCVHAPPKTSIWLCSEFSKACLFWHVYTFLLEAISLRVGFQLCSFWNRGPSFFRLESIMFFCFFVFMLRVLESMSVLTCVHVCVGSCLSQRVGFQLYSFWNRGPSCFRLESVMFGFFMLRVFESLYLFRHVCPFLLEVISLRK